MQVDSPLFRQYSGVKREHPDKLLLFRMGDFYEMFYDDAERASTLLGITLTQRKTATVPIPMAGVPVNSVEQYISRLVRLGEAVVICEQVGQSRNKGLMERKVVQIVTPGTITDQSLLPQGAAVVAMAVAPGAGRRRPAGYAWLDLARGELRASDCPVDRLGMHVERIGPAELLLPEGEGIPGKANCAVRHLPPWDFDPTSAHNRMCVRFGVKDLHGFGLEGHPAAVAATMALLDYAERTQCQQLDHLWQVGIEGVADQVSIEPSARRSLEISEPQVEGGPTLRSTLDRCVTPQGSRLLLRRLHEPIRDRGRLATRLDMVDAIAAAVPRLTDWLRGCCDLERVVTRLAMRSVRPRELGSVRDLLVRLPALWDLLDQLEGVDPARQWSLEAGQLASVAATLASMLVDEPPANVRDGNIIIPGHDAELDRLRGLSANATGELSAIAEREREATGIQALRVGTNRVHGYYIEVPRSLAGQLPARFQRRQTIKHAERFATEELLALETEVATAQEKIEVLERDLYNDMVERLQPATEDLRKLAEALAELDLTATLAGIRAERSWVRPGFRDLPGCAIQDGRHAIVEGAVSHFVPNTTVLDAANRMQVITGPNMGGKSTYMRQVALIALLAHAGMPVPATAAEFGPLDAIHTRIGSGDDLAGGRSTFMVEMAETAAILNTASPASLVILDEIGRGTSTFDGLSLAWATALALLQRNNSMVLLATHYHEMAELATAHDGVTNVHMVVGEDGGEAVMLYRVEEGPSNRSYGLQVARMAGLPAQALTDATNKLWQLEAAAAESQGKPFLPLVAPPPPPAVDHPVLRRVRDIDPDNLTPRQAQELVFELADMAAKDG